MMPSIPFFTKVALFQPPRVCPVICYPSLLLRFTSSSSALSDPFQLSMTPSSLVRPGSGKLQPCSAPCSLQQPPGSVSSQSGVTESVLLLIFTSCTGVGSPQWLLKRTIQSVCCRYIWSEATGSADPPRCTGWHFTEQMDQLTTHVNCGP